MLARSSSTCDDHGVRAYVGVTDTRWYRFLASRPQLTEVNFWRPGGPRAFRALRTGEPFLFKSHYPENRIVGGGFYSDYVSLPISEAWDFFGEGNGAPTPQLLVETIDARRTDKASLRTEIGCILLRDISFFDPYDDVPAPVDFAKNIVGGKRYELDALSSGHEVTRAVYRLTYPGIYLDPDKVPGPVFGDPRLTSSRLGQQSFKAMITANYHRTCAVTGDRIRPVLQAAHIRPVTAGGENRADNGLLLRSDVHTLFDHGYLGLDAQHRLRVSPRLRAEFENGQEFYDRAGRTISLPEERRHQPSGEFVEWHNDVVFLA